MKENYRDIETEVYLEEIPSHFSFIRGTGEIRHEVQPEQTCDLFICLDCGDKARLGFSAPLFESAGQTLCIDHHVSNEAFADFNHIVPDASSTSELVYHLLEDAKISHACAEALYMGIAHDTGVFQYSCTSPETMEAAANLMRKGIKGDEIIEKSYFEKSYVQNQILGKALLESMMILDRRCIVSYISQKDLRFFEAVPSDLDGIVSQLRQTAGVETAIFLYEMEPHTYKVSLRSKESVDVSRIANISAAEVMCARRA